MSHPSKVSLFREWAKAMVEGATVDKPNYGKSRTAKSKMKPSLRRRPGRRNRRHWRKKRAQD